MEAKVHTGKEAPTVQVRVTVPPEVFETYERVYGDAAREAIRTDLEVGGRAKMYGWHRETRARWARTRKEPRVDWLCSCGTGRLAVPETEVPDHCPMCGHPIAARGEGGDDA